VPTKRLEPLAANGARADITRLIGRTWYTVDLRPRPDRTFRSDALIHAVYRRMLEHIRDVAGERTA